MQLLFVVDFFGQRGHAELYREVFSQCHDFDDSESARAGCNHGVWRWRFHRMERLPRVRNADNAMLLCSHCSFIKP